MKEGCLRTSAGYFPPELLIDRLDDSHFVFPLKQVVSLFRIGCNMRCFLMRRAIFPCADESVVMVRKYQTALPQSEEEPLSNDGSDR